MSSDFPMIDAWVNPNVGLDYLIDEVGGLFQGGLVERIRRGTTLDQLIDEMDAAGITKAVLCADHEVPESLPWMQKAVEAHPDRFLGSIVLDAHTGIDAVRLLDRLVRDGTVGLARLLALRAQVDYDHAIFFPIYSKCVELDIPVTVNVGFPGPLVPARHQHPLPLEEVLYRYPDLRVIMAHGGDPWADICVKMLLKWPNLYYMTSAWSPRHIPTEIIEFLNTRGGDKIMWASDYPVLDFHRCRAEIEQIPFRSDDHRRRFVHDNAERVLFGGPPRD